MVGQARRRVLDQIYTCQYSGGIHGEATLRDRWKRSRRSFLARAVGDATAGTRAQPARPDQGSCDADRRRRRCRDSTIAEHSGFRSESVGRFDKGCLEGLRRENGDPSADEDQQRRSRVDDEAECDRERGCAAANSGKVGHSSVRTANEGSNEAGGEHGLECGEAGWIAVGVSKRVESSPNTKTRCADPSLGLGARDGSRRRSSQLSRLG